MVEIVDENLEKLKNKVLEFFAGEDHTLEYAEKTLSEMVNATILQLLCLNYELIDQKLLEN